MHPYLRLQILIRPLDDDRPAELAAPLVRRVLGKALIDIFCPFGQPHCEAPRRRGGEQVPPAELCHLAESCPYGVLFAASRGARPPYAVYVPSDRDDDDRIEITLFGPAWRFYPWLLQALRKALRTGLGKERRTYDVHAVYRVNPDSSWAEICSSDLSELLPTLPPDFLEVSMLPEPSPPAPLPEGEGSVEEPFPSRQETVEVQLLSPTRLIHDGKLLPGHRPVPFALLVARILDRFRGLFGDDAGEILRPEIRRAVEAEAAHVPLVSDETRWIEVQDYSARNRSELLLGGKVGRLIYGVEAARFLPILKAGEILHVGKNPTSGCGRIAVDLRGTGQ
jgi:hypothetical protein